MKEQLTSELVERLFAEIERAWMDRRDRTIVYKLADLHPELRDELYEFYEDLVLGASDVASDDSAAADARVADWLRTTGFAIVRAAAVETQGRASTAVKLAKVIQRAGLSEAPCDVCGYNGPGYYQPDKHPCALVVATRTKGE